MSDILIKGATMPKSCYECAGAYCDNNRWLCMLAGEYVDRFIYVECSRPTFCPLVEIPPHGDLIDGTKLISDICEKLDEVKCEKGSPDGEELWKIICNILETAPTIIESEVEE